jgi:hypothetical protein
VVKEKVREREHGKVRGRGRRKIDVLKDDVCKEHKIDYTIMPKKIKKIKEKETKETKEAKEAKKAKDDPKNKYYVFAISSTENKFYIDSCCEEYLSAEFYNTHPLSEHMRPINLEDDREMLLLGDAIKRLGLESFKIHRLMLIEWERSKVQTMIKQLITEFDTLTPHGYNIDYPEPPENPVKNEKNTVKKLLHMRKHLDNYLKTQPDKKYSLMEKLNS